MWNFAFLINFNENYTITFRLSENPIKEVSRSYLQKGGNLHFCSKKDHDACFFFQGWSFRPSGHRILWEDSFERKLKVLVPYEVTSAERGTLVTMKERNSCCEGKPITALLCPPRKNCQHHMLKGSPKRSAAGANPSEFTHKNWSKSTSTLLWSIHVLYLSEESYLSLIIMNRIFCWALLTQPKKRALSFLSFPLIIATGCNH